MLGFLVYFDRKLRLFLEFVCAGFRSDGPRLNKRNVLREQTNFCAFTPWKKEKVAMFYFTNIFFVLKKLFLLRSMVNKVVCVRDDQ